MANLTPSEDAEHKATVQYLSMLGIPFWHTNNEWYTTSWKQKTRSKAMGAQSGIPDLFICFPNQLIAIEMKRAKGGKISDNQKKWAEILEKSGIPTYVAYGFEEAKAIIDLCLTDFGKIIGLKGSQELRKSPYLRKKDESVF